MLCRYLWKFRAYHRWTVVRWHTRWTGSPKCTICSQWRQWCWQRAWAFLGCNLFEPWRVFGKRGLSRSGFQYSKCSFRSRWRRRCWTSALQWGRLCKHGHFVGWRRVSNPESLSSSSGVCTWWERRPFKRASLYWLSPRRTASWFG